MSSRLYPLFQRGNPQLRVFLPNFNMFIIKPNEAQPSNVVTFGCSMKMTKYDIGNYLTKIYKLPVKDIRVDIEMGQTRKALGANYIVKDEDLKVAYVTLGDNMTFEYPDLFPEDKVEGETTKARDDYDTVAKEFQKIVRRQTDRPGLPSWFGI